MGNWNEERTLRDDTGEARTLGKSHITKKHEDLFLRPPSELGNVYSQNSQRDETFGRVFGRKQDPNYVSEQKEKYCIKYVLWSNHLDLQRGAWLANQHMVRNTN